MSKRTFCLTRCYLWHKSWAYIFSKHSPPTSLKNCDEITDQDKSRHLQEKRWIQSADQLFY